MIKNNNDRSNDDDDDDDDDKPKPWNTIQGHQFLISCWSAQNPTILWHGLQHPKPSMAKRIESLQRCMESAKI